MKQCPKCNNQHNKPGIFCSRKCANGRVVSQETKDKIKKTVSENYASMSSEDKSRQSARALAGFIKAKKEHIENTPTELLSHNLRKKKVIAEQGNKCLHCGLSEWQQQQITLELDHIDGDKHNNLRSNLRCLCPNCHSLTPTWKTGNKPHWKHR